MASRLSSATSPYLRQHADNPVDWWQWGPEAFAEAKRRDVPLFVSVGYSSCHWCHVMAAESFSDPAAAELVNRYFVPVKVDREERPDVDQILMTATQAMTGQGGWPNSVFLTPDGKPYFAGTYFPPTQRDSMPSFSQVIETLGQAWQERRDEVLASSDQIVAHLAGQPEATAGDAPDPVAAVEAIMADFDQEHGGFGAAPKFPHAPALDALLVRTDPYPNAIALFSLESMARGGIHDQIGGGFHRYAVDQGWEVPHFEKMLYDNGLLLGTFVRGWRRAVPGDSTEQREIFEHVIRGIVRWLSEVMTVDGGAFAASQDADSLNADGEHEEGAYYLWSPALLDEVLSGNSRFAQGIFHVTVGGNLPMGAHAPTDGIGLSTLQFHGNPHPERYLRVLGMLQEARAKRPAPARDDKVVAEWNGYTIDSLVTAAMIFHEQDWLDRAQAAADYLWSVHWNGERLARTSLAGKAGAPGVLADYAAVALSFARLAGALGDAQWLERAEILVNKALGLFVDADGKLWDAEPSAELYDRPRATSDEGTPSPTSTFVLALRLVSAFSDRAELNEQADRFVADLYPMVEFAPRFAGWALLDLLQRKERADGHGPAQIVVAAPEANPFGELNQAVWRVAPSGSALLTAGPESTGFGYLLEGRTDVGRPTAFICRDHACLMPITDWAELREPLWGAPEHGHSHDAE